MFSPYDAVYGHDTTYIRRMTVEEYVQELQEEEADVRGEAAPPQQQQPPATASQGENAISPASPSPLRRGSARQYEQRRMALSSRNPNVVFSSKYPMYDRLGRELCVAFQMQDMAVQQELRRLEGDAADRHHRRSGVRLSAELPMESDTNTHTSAGTGSGGAGLSRRASAATAEGHELTQTEEASHLVRPSHMDGDTFVDVDVSATSHYPSASASRTSSRPASARPSEFSIFRDSRGGGLLKARSTVPTRTAAEETGEGGSEEGILIRRTGAAAAYSGGGTGGGALRATSMPPALLPRLPRVDDGDNGVSGRRSQWRWRPSEKRQRSRSSGNGNGGRHSRVRFLNGDNDDGDGAPPLSPTDPEPVTSANPPRHKGAAPLPPRLPTPPPVPLSEPEATRADETTNADEATRWTTAVRATKQLFRSTVQTVTPPRATTTTTVAGGSRTTTTLAYAQPITSSAYGQTATVVAASKVQTVVEENVQAAVAALPPALYTAAAGDGEAHGAGGTHAGAELQCGAVVSLGDAWYRLDHFHVVAEVYEATQVRAPTEAVPRVRSGSPATAPSPAVSMCVADTTAPEACAQANAAAKTATAAETSLEVRERENGEEAAHAQPQSPADGEKQHAANEKDQSAAAAVQAKSTQQFLVYRWRAASLPRGADEACRAALGLSLCAPLMQVRGVRYRDGSGITVLALPPGHRAVPISGLPLSLRSYTTLLRVVLKAVSAMVARRTVHGDVSALGELFLVCPVAAKSTPSPARDENAIEGEALATKGAVVDREAGHGAIGAAREPFVLPFHWERWVDFSMFVDRNAGRTLPFDFEDGTAQSTVTYGKDVLSTLQLLLEHPLSAELTSEQYILLQKLIVMAAEPTQVANHLIQMKNLMLALPSDAAALQQSFDSAVVHYTR